MSESIVLTGLGMIFLGYAKNALVWRSNKVLFFCYWDWVYGTYGNGGELLF